ncbi:MAG: hypothetical protein WBJ54_06085 [Syntrophorhabdus sp.]|jgi:vacuolar-type H+-ATPase subunit H|nr:hypothetical protein [Pseudomonadota bacterium]NMC94540.1 hypothetical protein [Syntrophorhabdus sp.]HNY71105.1 hypothetical protein [Syntrophorhabdus sp.]HOH27289.1 hypothetical protein [Syntrophorhabdus sp.]HQP56195.1 hypothetical protein [Syntrophorhabdus sp.]
MRDVIQKIISVENEANVTIQDARAEAERITSDARKKSNDLIENARQEALTEAKKIIDALIQDAEKEKQQQLASAAIEIEKRVRLDPAIREWAVEGVVRCVCKQP